MARHGQPQLLAMMHFKLCATWLVTKVVPPEADNSLKLPKLLGPTPVGIQVQIDC